MILIFVSQIEHGNILFNRLKNKGVENCIFFHGGLHKKIRKEYTENIHNQKYDVVIGSSVLNEGFDESGFDVVIIASGGKSSIQLTQKIGRGLRPKIGKEAIIIDFIDVPKFLIDHYKKRRAVLEQDFEVIDV